MSARYTIAGGHAGKDRLDVLARVHGPHTTQLLDRVGVPEGARCLDVGCGGGHVSRELARRTGDDGSVVAIDMDSTVLERARADAAADGVANLEFRCGDATDIDGAPFDLAYARFLLCHVGNPADVLAAMVAALEPGGVVIVEDTDFTACVSYPPCVAYERWVALYRETVRRRGGNADIGPMLPSMLFDAGVQDVGVAMHQPCALDGDIKLMSPLTLERIGDSVVNEGVATADEVAAIGAELAEFCADPTTLLSTPRVVQSWGVTPR
jgi:SAM-dependent methyltransferase